MAPILGIYASQISGHLFAPSGAYESIATISGSGGGRTFTSIPQNYTHLQIRAIARETGSSTPSNVVVRFNGDTASNYSWHYLQGDGSSATSYGLANQTYIPVSLSPSSTNTANVYCAAVIDILDYTNTNKYKTVRSLSGFDANGSGYVNLYSGSWRNTAAVTSILISDLFVGDDSGTSFALYGIKGA